MGLLFPGADDNASGTAGVIELARWYAKQPKLKRGILFLNFAGEEIATAEAAGELVAQAFEHAGLYEEVRRLHLANLRALSSALSAKDFYTLGHASRVAAYTALLGRELGWPDDRLEAAENAAFLHDIGKIGVSDRVLLKAGDFIFVPKDLDEKTFEEIRLDIERRMIEGYAEADQSWEGARTKVKG